MNNKLLRNEMINLRLEERKLLEFLINHKTICNLRFTMIASQLEQLYQTNQFNQSSNQSDNFNHQSSVMPLSNQQLSKSNQIKIELDYDKKLDNQLNQISDQINNQVSDQQCTNQQQTFDSTSELAKIEDYNYQTNFNDNQSLPNYQPTNCFNNNSNAQQSYSSSQLNYDQFSNQNSTNYDSINLNSLNKSTESSSSNLANVDYLCTNDDTPNENVFLMC